MLSYFQDILKRATSVDSDAEARVIIVSGMRQLLQVVAFGLLDWIAARSPDPDIQPPNNVLDALHAPTDGSLVEAVDALLISAEQNGWGGVCRIGSQQLPDTGGCAELCTDYPTTTLGLLHSMVAMRNDGGEGHGLPGGYRRFLECAAFDALLHAFTPVLPTLEGDNANIGPDGCEVGIRTMQVRHGRPVLIRKVQEVNTATARIRAQSFTDAGDVERFTYETANAFSKFNGESLPCFKTYHNAWSPLYYLPDRVTDTFTGRDTERAALLEWLDDRDARACLVYGDGGVGKTTLVVEVLHELLDEDAVTEWKPKVISFLISPIPQPVVA